ncbi:hypothetical protein GCM10009775_26360 [Microbacterium aoyamense]|uniref:Tfp pilus assembly protein PilO n=1 Tax=Microbacterium aoyamense TaxID=344166 RepID=A0ABN2PV04_9MICO|nr:type 4a pilus biogenesis protein PilO [Microbacterium aoyamense]
MPKQLINTIGAIIAVAVLLAGVGLVALPLWLQSTAVQAQALAVQQSNDVQQSAVDGLAAEQSQLDDLEDDLAALEAEIPSAARIDTISALVATAASETGVTVTSFSPSEPVSFEAAAASASGSDAPATDAAEAAPAEPGTGRVQIPVTIDVTAPSLDSMTAFLDALRAGPRLLASIQPQIATGSEGATATITALALALIPAAGE